jgi:hypothetical protein
MNTCYVYKWTHLPTMKWYVGSRTAKNSHPNDGYICSSRLVKPLIMANPKEWSKQIVDIGSKEDMLALESEILQLFDARNDPRSFNQHNNEGRPFPLVLTPWNKGKKLTAEQSGWTEERREAKRQEMKGKPSRAKGAKWSEEAKARKAKQNSGVNNPRYGAVVSDEQKAKQSKSMTGKPSHWKGKSNPKAAENGKKSAAKVSATATGRKMAIREDGTRYWIYPQRESTNNTK